MVKMPNNEAESEDSGPDVNSSESDSEMSGDFSESSEMTENELRIGRKIADYPEILNELEKQFFILREELYKERIKQVDHQLHEIENGMSKEYLGPLQALADRMNARKEVAEILKKYRLENIRNKFESEEQASRQNYESEKQIAVDKLFEELNEKIRRLEEDSHNVDISWADWGSNVRSSKVRGPGRKKPVTVTGPYIVYMLREEEIMEDWTLIRKAVKGSRMHQQRVHSII
ncbi:CLUMA_CG011036, isoform A [Clunio marinus]|uniref:CLUMA_CG011036, isoform A n=1 Tax=Clunio marinus TaxID=568069 RepID=A0A1J1IBS3_9DIPT|nr:CLUMA_CG011036, isoform A [Clunio marinus]